MASLGSSISRRLPNAFLDEEDVTRIREGADEVDATYGAALDAIAPALLVALTETSRAA